MSMIEEMIAYQIGYAFIEVGLCSTPESAFGYLPRDGEDRKYLVQVIARFMFPEYPDDVEFDRVMADMEGYLNNPADDLHEKAKLLIRINKLLDAMVEQMQITRERMRTISRQGGTRRGNLTRSRQRGGKPPGRIPGAMPISEAELDSLQKEIDSLTITKGKLTVK